MATSDFTAKPLALFHIESLFWTRLVLHIQFTPISLLFGSKPWWLRTQSFHKLSFLGLNPNGYCLPLFSKFQRLLCLPFSVPYLWGQNPELSAGRELVHASHIYSGRCRYFLGEWSLQKQSVCMEMWNVYSYTGDLLIRILPFWQKLKKKKKGIFLHVV